MIQTAVAYLSTLKPWQSMAISAVFIVLGLWAITCMAAVIFAYADRTGTVVNIPTEEDLRRDDEAKAKKAYKIFTGKRGK